MFSGSGIRVIRKAGNRGFKAKWGQGLGIKSIKEMQDPENNHRDYGIERKF